MKLTKFPELWCFYQGYSLFNVERVKMLLIVVYLFIFLWSNFIIVLYFYVL